MTQVEIRNPENAFSFCSRQELIETQKSDSSLDKVRSLVINEPSGFLTFWATPTIL
jgi:hypothetical protein